MVYTLLPLWMVVSYFWYECCVMLPVVWQNNYHLKLIRFWMIHQHWRRRIFGLFIMSVGNLFSQTSLKEMFNRQVEGILKCKIIIFTTDTTDPTLHDILFITPMVLLFEERFLQARKTSRQLNLTQCHKTLTNYCKKLICCFQNLSEFKLWTWTHSEKFSLGFIVSTVKMEIKVTSLRLFHCNISFKAAKIIKEGQKQMNLFFLVSYIV